MRRLAGANRMYTMSSGCRLSSCAVIALAAALGCRPASAQEVPRTSWGDPDLQGVWVASTLTPLERPSEYRGREFLTEAEVTALEAEARVEERRQQNRPAERAPAGGDVDYRPDGSLGFNHFWLDEGTTWQPSGRTSLNRRSAERQHPLSAHGARPRTAVRGRVPGTRTSTSTRASGASVTGFRRSGSATTRTTRSSRRRPTS